MTATGRHPIRKFNPGTFQSDREVVEQFVVRTRELDTVLGILRDNAGSPSCQHMVVVAPRGRGKTMLLARTAAELRTNGDFSGRLLPVRFMEESQEIFHLADFWLETLFHLAGECESRDPGLAGELRARHAELSGRWREPALEGQARASVLDAADRLGRRLVLMVENLQALFRDVDEDFGWKLRSVLQTEPQIMLLGSATSRFPGLDDGEQPFFKFFRIIDLQPLVTEECRLLWEMVSGDAVSGREMRPLEILTGGSPRLLVIVAGAARHGSMRRLMEELVVLIDNHTEHFRGHLDVLPKTERRVYLSVLDLWQHSTPGEIAARARMDPRIVSTMLGRLVNRGAVTVDGSGRKRQYAAAERLYSIYYKLRRERDKAALVENMIRFMAVFYSEAEQEAMFPALVSGEAEPAAIRDGLDRAAAGIPAPDRLLRGLRRPRVETAPSLREEISSGPPADVNAQAGADEFIERLRADIAQRLDDGAFAKVIEIVDRALDPQSGVLSGSSGTLVAWALNRKADACLEMGDWDRAVAACTEVVARFGASRETRLEREVAEALNGKTFSLLNLGEPRSALPVCEDVVERFGASGDAVLRQRVAFTLLWKGLVQEELGELDSALQTYRRVAGRLETSQEPEVERCVARAMVRKASVLRKLGDPEGSLRSCQDVVDRFGESEDPELAQVIATAQFAKGHLLHVRGELAPAISVWEAVVERFGASDEPELQRCVARAMVRKGSVLRKLGDPEGSLRSCQDVVDRFGESEDPELAQVIAAAQFAKGHLLRDRGELAPAISVWEAVVERFGTGDEPELRPYVAMALSCNASVHEKLGNLDEALSAYEEIHRRFGANSDRELHDLVANAWIGKAEILARHGRHDRRSETFEEVERSLGKLGEQRPTELTRRAMRAHAQLLLAQRDIPAAMERFQSLYRMSEPTDDVMLRGVLVLVPALIAAGVAATDLVEVLTGDEEKAAALGPLLVALRQEAGETVRAPAEILEVATDIREDIQGKREVRADGTVQGSLDLETDAKRGAFRPPPPALN